MFAPKRFSDRLERFGVDQLHRPAPGRIPGTMATVVSLGAGGGVPSVAGVEGTVGAADDVHEVHDQPRVMETA